MLLQLWHGSRIESICRAEGDQDGPIAAGDEVVVVLLCLLPDEAVDSGGSTRETPKSLVVVLLHRDQTEPHHQHLTIGKARRNKSKTLCRKKPLHM